MDMGHSAFEVTAIHCIILRMTFSRVLLYLQESTVLVHACGTRKCCIQLPDPCAVNMKPQSAYFGPVPSSVLSDKAFRDQGSERRPYVGSFQVISLPQTHRSPLNAPYLSILKGGNLGASSMGG